MELSKKSRSSVVKESSVSFSETKKVVSSISDRAMAHIADRLIELYTDPLAATVRETMSNAYDATVLVPASERKPIDVKLPTALSPSLVITDLGVGMSPETVEKVFVQYGESDKSTNFNVIGAYGLGAKAPLSYSNSFSVKTVKDGVKTVFESSRTDRGIESEVYPPQTVDAPNGTSITIPVRQQDVPRIQELIKEYGRKMVDVEMTINSKQYISEKPLFEIGQIELLEGRPSRVWVSNDRSPDRYTNISNVELVLSGWGYKPWGRSMNSASIYIEIFPGMVSFSSSRDEIVVDERLSELRQKIVEMDIDFSHVAHEFAETMSFESWRNFVLQSVASGCTLNHEFNISLNPTVKYKLSSFTYKGLDPAEFYARNQPECVLLSPSRNAEGLFYRKDRYYYKIQRNQLVEGQEFNGLNPDKCGFKEIFAQIVNGFTPVLMEKDTSIFELFRMRKLITKNRNFIVLVDSVNKEQLKKTFETFKIDFIEKTFEELDGEYKEFLKENRTVTQKVNVTRNVAMVKLNADLTWDTIDSAPFFEKTHDEKRVLIFTNDVKGVVNYFENNKMTPQDNVYVCSTRIYAREYNKLRRNKNLEIAFGFANSRSVNCESSAFLADYRESKVNYFNNTSYKEFESAPKSNIIYYYLSNISYFRVKEVKNVVLGSNFPESIKTFLKENGEEPTNRYKTIDDKILEIVLPDDYKKLQFIYEVFSNGTFAPYSIKFVSNNAINNESDDIIAKYALEGFNKKLAELAKEHNF